MHSPSKDSVRSAAATIRIAMCPSLAQPLRLRHHHHRTLSGRGSMRISVACLGMFMLAGAAQAGTLRIGLNEDPDALDPARGGSFVGRVVFAAVCDKLIDIDAQNSFVPQLATQWSWSPDNL